VLFTDLQLIEPLLQALQAEGYTTPTPIQQKAIPPVLEGKDLLGGAQTGTGKTAAFTLPILQRMFAEYKQGMKRTNPRALILTPTRELAIQIGESIAAYGKFLPLKHTVIFGGVSQHQQVMALRSGVDIVVATPGRLLDLMQQQLLSLRDINYFVLDEADRMLDMGFVHDVKRVVAKLPAKRQTLFFSATMPTEIKQLAAGLLINPVYVEVTPVSSTAERIQQTVYFTPRQDKLSLLVHLLQDSSIESVLVFMQMKHAANKLCTSLIRAGIPAEAIHGNKSQNARQLALSNFKNRRTRVLVATDIAARGIDIDDLTHVVNFELPNVPETYVHRIGRTGRAGAEGIAISFCEPAEKPFLQDIQKLIRQTIPVSPTPEFERKVQPIADDKPPRREGNYSSRNGNSGGGYGNNRSSGSRPSGNRPSGSRPSANRSGGNRSSNQGSSRFAISR